MRNVTLKKLLQDADERVRKAAADALNKAGAELVNDIRSNMSAQGIEERTGNLRGSVKASKATAKRPSLVVKSEVYKPAPRRPGWRNPAMKGRYPAKGVPYGRVIEFSPRINKPFFYKAWYADRKKIIENVISEIGKAWSK